MAESVTKPGIANEHEHLSRENTASNAEEEKPQAGLPESPSKVIWTPRFIVIFALTLVLGLSVEGLLTNGWLDSYYTGQWIFQVHVLLNFICWLALVVVARSTWVRIGGIFGCIWALFMSVNITINAFNIDPSSPVLSSVNAAICIALLGSYICLSIARTSFSRLDSWLFGLAPLAGSIAVLALFFLTPGGERSLKALENFIATIALVLCVLVWWLRPTSWKTQAGPTFLFGSVPALLLLLAIPSAGFNMSNFFLAHVVPYLSGGSPYTEANFFLPQVALLCLLLGTMRVLQGEIRA